MFYEQQLRAIDLCHQKKKKKHQQSLSLSISVFNPSRAESIERNQNSASQLATALYTWITTAKLASLRHTFAAVYIIARNRSTDTQ